LSAGACSRFSRNKRSATRGKGEIRGKRVITKMSAPTAASTPGKPAAASKRRKNSRQKRERPHHSSLGCVRCRVSFTTRISPSRTRMAAVVGWSSAGAIGFKGSRNGYAYRARAGFLAAAACVRPVRDEELGVRVKGPAPDASPPCRAVRGSAHIVFCSATSRSRSRFPRRFPHNGLPSAQAAAAFVFYAGQKRFREFWEGRI